MKRILTPSDFTVMPWKNRQGSTTEMLHVVENGGLKWRISRACVVADQEFSIFAGVARNLTVVSGAGFWLQGDGVSLPALPLLPIAFSGDVQLRAQGVQGPCDDFNVMTDQSLPRPEVAVINGRAHIAQADLLAIYALEKTLIDGAPLTAGNLMTSAQGLHLDGHAIAVRLFC